MEREGKGKEQEEVNENARMSMTDEKDADKNENELLSISGRTVNGKFKLGLLKEFYKIILG